MLVGMRGPPNLGKHQLPCGKQMLQWKIWLERENTYVDTNVQQCGTVIKINYMIGLFPYLFRLH
jgi:hypothetical protein